MKLKLNKKTGLLIGLVVFVITLGVLGWISFQNLEEKTRLEKQLTTSQTRLQAIKLEPLSSQPADLENQLSQILPEYEAVKAKLSEPVNSTNASAAVFDVAKTYGLTVIEITSSSPTDEQVTGVTLSAISMTARVQGKASKMVSFITALNDFLKTSVFTSVEITVPEIIAADNTTISNGDNATANIKMVIYTYQGE